jgi:membrane associated rhomboid family serine protease
MLQRVLVTPASLSNPLLVLTALSLAAFAYRLRKAGSARAMADWWLSLAAVVAVGLGSLALAPLRPLAGVLAFCALVLLCVAPLRLERAASRAARLAHRRTAIALSILAAILHPSRRNLRQPAALSTLLALRVGREPDARALAALSAGDPAVERALDVLVAHARGALPEAAARWASLDDRALFLSMGMGLIGLRLAGLLDRSPEALVRAVAECEALDPSMRDPDRRALLVAFGLAYAGDLEGARTASERLAPYMAPGEPEAARAIALWCAGDPSASEALLRDAIARHHRDPAARYALETLGRTLASLPAPSRSLHAPALAALIERLRAESAALAAIAPLEGRAATPWLTAGWCAALGLAYVLSARGGSTLDPEHLARVGGLVTSEYDPSTGWPRLFTHGLLHAGPVHLGFNLVALGSFGRFCEGYFGRARSAVIYLAAAVTSGSAVVRYADPLRPTVLVGASGSIFALGGAMVAAVITDRALRATPRGRSELASLVVLFATQSVMDRYIPGVAATAHTAGLGTGLILGALFVLLGRSRVTSPRG